MACKFEFTREKTRGTIKVTIPLVDINEKYKEILKENISKIKMKGFRPGHVPTSIIEKQFGEQFKFDAINDILQKEYKDYAILTTGKDLVKLKEFNIKNLYLMDLEIKIDENVDFSLMNEYIESFNKGV